MDNLKAHGQDAVWNHSLSKRDEYFHKNKTEKLLEGYLILGLFFVTFKRKLIQQPTGVVSSLVTLAVFKTVGGRIPSPVSSILICSRQIFAMVFPSGNPAPLWPSSFRPPMTIYRLPSGLCYPVESLVVSLSAWYSTALNFRVIYSPWWWMGLRRPSC